MATSENRQQFPNLGAALVTPEGLLTQEWRQFFSTLWARSGSAIGGLDIKIGTMVPFAGSAVPTGYLLCDGSAVLRVNYPNLFAAIGTTWGAGNGDTTFNLPDARGKTLIGKSGDFPLGSTGGIDEIVLSVENLPEHLHVLTDPGHTHGATSGPHTHIVTDPGHGHVVTDPGHIHTVTDPGHVHSSLVANALGTAGADPNSVAGNTGSAPTGVTVDSATTGVTVANSPTGITIGGASGTTTIDAAVTGIEMEPVGAGEEFSVQNPYIAVNWIIKA